MSFDFVNIVDSNHRFSNCIGTNSLFVANLPPFSGTHHFSVDDLESFIANPEYISCSVDQSGTYMLATYSLNETTIFHFYVSGTAPLEYSFTGKYPNLFFNGIVNPKTGEYNTACFYITGDEKILCRNSIDFFASEEVFFSGTQVFEKLYQVKTESDFYYKALLFAKTVDGSYVVLQTADFEKFTNTGEAETFSYSETGSWNLLGAKFNQSSDIFHPEFYTEDFSGIATGYVSGEFDIDSFNSLSATIFDSGIIYG